MSLVRLKTFAREASARSLDGSEELLTVSHITGVTRRSEKTVYMFEAESLEGYKVVEPGDLVVNTMWAWMGALGSARTRGVVSPSYAVYRLDQTRADPRFVEAYLRQPQVVAEMEARSTGVWKSRLRLYPDDLLNMRIELPPVQVQRLIADYLDAESVRIDGLIEIRRRILGLIAERRRLATDRMLAEFPGSVDWPVVKLKYVVRGFVDTLHATAPEEEDGPGYIVGTACIKSGSLNLAVARRCSTHTLREWTKRALPQPGDVLLTREAPAGEAALVPVGIELAPGQRVVLVQTDRQRMLPELVLHSIYSARAGRFFDELGRETTVAHLNMSDIGALPVVLPPLEAQSVVTSKIAAELDSLDRASSTMSRQIELLLERRQALITAAVTGQLDIPGMAA